MTLTQAYVLLIVSILLEITATGSLKATEGFTRWIPSFISVIAISGCMFLMSHVMKILPVGITYATWSGVGIVALTLIGIIKYKQIPNLATIFGLALIIIGVIIVNLMNNTKIDN
ncbi:multidrug efflux SMR transporter [Candidatus Pelagibacter sp.]|nr:multidrug efflux SMR transporter [Candidatus Pelagibacter sp.]MDC0855574.1 multidrug efflux SMR transporter [Candidatus Pelagibacter sp.]